MEGQMSNTLKRFHKILITILFMLTVSVTPLHAEPRRTLVNLRGNRVLIPMDVPAREDFVLQRRITVDDRLIVFLYHDPKYRRTVDYAETYNLNGELMEITWYKPTKGVKRARDINLDDPETAGLAGVLRILDEVPEPDRRPDS
ncbi:MAG: hypothetical protein V3S55_01650 [Nitrospiraceae bacterium]